MIRVAPPPTVDPVEFVDRLVEQNGAGQEQLIPLLQAVQREFRYLPEAALRRVAERTRASAADVAGVASFYSQFRLRPVGKHLISVCHGTACHVKGARLIDDALHRLLRIPAGDDTDPEGLFTVQDVACLGCCTLAPVMQIDGVSYGHLTPNNVERSVQDFLEITKKGGDRDTAGKQAYGALTEIRIATDSCCAAAGSLDVRDALESAVREIGAPAVVKPIGCLGMCHAVPMVEVAPPGKQGRIYARVGPAEAENIVREHFRPKGIAALLKSAWQAGLDRLLTDESWEPVTRYALDVRDAPVCEFLGIQKRIATEACGNLDPLDLDEYLAHRGFEALRSALDQGNPEAVVEAVSRSGLRGRGGAGFPTGRKWATVRAAEGDPKYIVCNGDEGDPGAFMDRMLLESFPYRVLEGMAIAAYAVGARKGYLYIRAEYPHAVRRIREAIKRCEERGLLGRSIFGGKWSLELTIVEGAGAFVCGEETALIASIEGRRGEPRIRPPYPAVSGLWGKPTCINNVETYAMVPWIIRNGPEAFAAIGTETSKGTKVFSLAGKVRRGGLIEVPMGTTIRQIVEGIGGGAPEGRTFKAVQIGGPSGGCIPASLADTPVDYEALQKAGAIMGSGGLVVLDDSTCMVEVARYFLEFTQKESCGKCTMCRLGTKRLLDMLDAICEGRGRPGDLERLEDLASQVTEGSLCGLGQTAPNPILTTLRYFREEYEEHLRGRCPAGQCTALIAYQITESCIGCTLCAQACPVDAIPMRPFERHTIDTALCTRCDACRQVCPDDSVRIVDARKPAHAAGRLAQ